jgi:hypothetical protein
MGFELKLIMPYLYFFSIDLSLFGSVKGDLTKDGIRRCVSITKKRSQFFFSCLLQMLSMPSIEL